ncbi:hypothetical protein ACJMK2_021736 [Sinanodonta woodiana]|uniref:Thiamine pyrophosphokinase n=1 Tax=Sinanodonta woodiana TaxID=1069815 RepID=A0ABD3TGY3_SINWO
MDKVSELHRKPLHYLKDDADSKLVLILLNQPIGSSLQILKVLWKKAIFKAATDGSVNHLFSELGESRDSYLPDIISGDFDSATPSTLEYYKGKGVEIIPTPEQDATDFTKSIRITAKKTKDMQKDAVVILGAFGGRMDHVFGNIDTLFEAGKLMPGVPVYLLSDDSLVTLLEKDIKTEIHIDSGYEGEWCGLIPIGCPCEHVTTSGLKWNLDDDVLKFGELVSTSNAFAGSSSVTVKTDAPLLWTMGVNYRR